MPQKPTANAREQDEWILREDQLACLASATRMDIVDHLAAHGPMAVRELAPAIGMKPSAIYHHLEQLVEVGLVADTGSRTHNGKAEALYNTPSRRMRLRRALEDPANAETMQKIVTALGRRAQRDFSQGQRQAEVRASGDARNLGFFRLVNRMDAKRLARMNALLDEVAELMWQEGDEDGELVALTWVMAPLG
ncbi:winged helix-turn-helix domain-containing protein [Qipengyuania sphaerica]|uniref:winged helix-turn-helix domain-containing protein n=1 Tax=Qipengyuania sphaerica TaxID=2867243 RepID=UPI001C87285F|nr:helix-turn-helix domain-containing protein [Qipengyuania sphaerica]MBX7540351.1 helix-turn-helix domain-containing protein [Qipengyuania sphaerica]